MKARAFVGADPVSALLARRLIAYFRALCEK
jgi:hypothetical protein